MMGPHDYVEWMPQDPQFLAWLAKQPAADLAEYCAPCARAAPAAALNTVATPAPAPARELAHLLMVGIGAAGLALGAVAATAWHRRGRR